MPEQEQPYQRAMVVVAHPDDAEWMCAGTVAKWCAEGWEVVYVLCTDGSKGSSDPNMTGEELVRIREAEQREACRRLGVSKIVFLGYPDAHLEPTMELRKDLTREIRRHQPDVLIAENPMRNLKDNHWLEHPDHLAAGEAALSAVFPTARDRLTFPDLLEEGLEPHKVKEVWIGGGEQGSDHFVDVADHMEKAIAALKAHRSQLSEEDADKYFPLGREETAKKVGLRYAEAFKAIKLW
jgi:LmbE family N-acetylglucosaminyl deacetylase